MANFGYLIKILFNEGPVVIVCWLFVTRETSEYQKCINHGSLTLVFVVNETKEENRIEEIKEMRIFFIN